MTECQGCAQDECFCDLQGDTLPELIWDEHSGPAPSAASLTAEDLDRLPVGSVVLAIQLYPHTLVHRRYTQAVFTKWSGGRWAADGSRYELDSRQVIAYCQSNSAVSPLVIFRPDGWRTEGPTFAEQAHMAAASAAWERYERTLGGGGGEQ